MRRRGPLGFPDINPLTDGIQIKAVLMGGGLDQKCEISNFFFFFDWEPPWAFLANITVFYPYPPPPHPARGGACLL